jgi:hypothetical protein
MSDKYKTLPLYRGKPCRHGHMNGLRYSSSRACRDCVIERARMVRQSLTLARRRERASEIDIDCNC